MITFLVSLATIEKKNSQIVNNIFAKIYFADFVKACDLTIISSCAGPYILNVTLNIFLKAEFEEFSQSYSKATSLSYTAGVADLDSVNNFSKDEASEINRDDDSNLQQTKQAITEAKRNLDGIILLLQK